MLHLLPRDILVYILSMLVYDRWAKRYCAVSLSVAENIELMSHYFCYRYNTSVMAQYVKRLSLVHPLFRDILRNATDRRDPSVWGFHTQFFHTLSQKQ